MDMTIPTDLRAKALGEIKVFQARLWKKVTGEEAEDEDINPASEIWLNEVLKSMSHDPHERLPDFSLVENFEFYQEQSIAWMEIWKRIRIQQAQLWGLSEETAKDVTSVIRQSIY